MPTMTLDISDATFVSSAQPNSNFSFYPLMYTGTDARLLNCISLMRITLPELPVNQVDNAKLQLTMIAKSGASPSPIVVNKATSYFDPSTVTYSTRPSFTATTSAVNISTTDINVAVNIDVTDLINNWLSGAPNNGIVLTNSNDKTLVEFAKNAVLYELYFPKLVLTYSSTPLDNTAICFSYAQLANLITQLIRFYPTATMSVYTKGFNAATVSGTPVKLYASPDATYGTLVVLGDGGYGAVPLNAISAIGLPAGMVYNPLITYLTAPVFPTGCDKNLITAYHDYLPLSTSVTVYSGTLIQASGIVYKNEYGILVLADDNLGTNPTFMPVVNITAIVTSTPANKTQSHLITSSKDLISIPLPQVKK